MPGYIISGESLHPFDRRMDGTNFQLGAVRNRLIYGC